MDAIVYKNTKTNIPRTVDLHKTWPIGIAYVINDYFVHMYGTSTKLCGVYSNAAVSQYASGKIEDWVSNIFGATDISPSKNSIGEAIIGVWRPGLYFQNHIFQAFNLDEHEQRSAEQALKILIDKLEDILLYIEPSAHGMNTYSHKTRELLILACTEIETTWKFYLNLANYSGGKGNLNTEDYVKLCPKLFLEEYEIKLRPYKTISPVRPFLGWNPTCPSKSIPWYSAYNNTKHDRVKYFHEATLEHCIAAVAANIVMFCVRYSPHPLTEGEGSFSALMNQLFEVSLIKSNPETFYIPKITPSTDHRKDLMSFQAQKFDLVEPWVAQLLIL